MGATTALTTTTCTKGVEELCLGTYCDEEGIDCVPPPPADPACEGKPDGCYHGPHHDYTCSSGLETLCLSGSYCDDEGTKCVNPADAWCAGKRDGCYTAHSGLGFYTCRAGAGMLCPQDWVCGPGGVNAECVEP
ncbi:hypothetical protein ABPG75_002284 [Micractinium tetrahymenae]